MPKYAVEKGVTASATQNKQGKTQTKTKIQPSNNPEFDDSFPVPIYPGEAPVKSLMVKKKSSESTEQDDSSRVTEHSNEEYMFSSGVPFREQHLIENLSV